MTDVSPSIGVDLDRHPAERKKHEYLDIVFFIFIAFLVIFIQSNLKYFLWLIILLLFLLNRMYGGVQNVKYKAKGDYW